MILRRFFFANKSPIEVLFYRLYRDPCQSTIGRQSSPAISFSEGGSPIAEWMYMFSRLAIRLRSGIGGGYFDCGLLKLTLRLRSGIGDPSFSNFQIFKSPPLAAVVQSTKEVPLPNYPTSRCRIASYRIIPAATDTFRESNFVAIGIRINTSARFNTSLEIPLSSAPITIQLGILRSA